MKMTEEGKQSAEDKYDPVAPGVELPPIETVANDDVTKTDMLIYIWSALVHNGLIGHNIESFNSLIDKGLPFIITNLFVGDITVKNLRVQTEMDRQRESVHIKFRFTEAEVGRPKYSEYIIGTSRDMMPNLARRSSLTYSAPVSIAAEVTLTAKYRNGQEITRHAVIPKFQILRIPIMIRSNRCHTYKCPRSVLKELEEDPNEYGGYFIAKGQEYAVQSLENIRFNMLHTHFKIMPNEVIRGEFISQPGGTFENSSEIILRYMTSGALTVELNSTKFSKVQFPFYLLYRLFEMTSDREIAKTITLVDTADEGEALSAVTQRIVNILDTAFGMSNERFESLVNVVDCETIVQTMARNMSSYITNTQSYETNKDAVKYLNTNLQSILDKVVLPHIGVRPEHRIRKMRFLGLLFNEMLQVEMGIVAPTDRDSYVNKRVHGAGVSLAKSIKTHFNKSVVTPVMRSLKRLVANNQFETIVERDIVNSFQNSLVSADLDKVMEQAITTGNKTLRLHLNRVASAVLERKNMFNSIISCRTVVAHSASNASKQTSRADLMRRVHATYWGFICPSKSADTGEAVGMNKEFAMTATPTEAGEHVLLKEYLEADPEVLRPDQVDSADIVHQNLTCVYVNGDWMGCCRNAPALLRRYRHLRREGKSVDPTTTIAWNPVIDRVEFLLDIGRVIRPLLIVYSNIDDYDESCRAARSLGSDSKSSKRVPFVQNVRLTKSHIVRLRAGAMTINDLLREGVVEFISPEEQVNCHLAESMDVLRENRHNVLKQYTHCDVEIAIFGLSAAMSPFGNHTQPARVTYETAQSRSTGGWYAFNWPFRIDKQRFNQFTIETPLLSTIVSRMVYPNGYNCFVAYCCLGGDNQEDSSILNNGSIQRGMFEGSYFNYEKAELDTNERICNPDVSTTRNLNPNASYEKLVDGIVPVGTAVVKGDVVIGRVLDLQRRERDEQYTSVDKSVVYRYNQPAVVDAVWRPRGANDEMFALVKFRYVRPINIGDKLSSRSGNKLIVSSAFNQSDMPYTEGGLTPDIVVNPHSIPKRMVIGQMIEAAISKVCARKGVITDGTSFSSVSLPEIAAEMLRYGLRYNGRERMFNGMTGEYFDAAIFVAPTYTQRLLKFAADEHYAAPVSGPTDAVTGQPLEGKRVQGGLRFGEMEGSVLQSHGSMFTLYEKFSKHSDGRKQTICRNCGNMAVYNQKESIYNCSFCDQMAEICQVESTKSSIVLQEELRSSGIKIKYGLAPKEFEAVDE